MTRLAPVIHPFDADGRGRAVRARAAGEVDPHPGRRGMRRTSLPAIVALRAIRSEECPVIFDTAIVASVTMAVFKWTDAPAMPNAE